MKKLLTFVAPAAMICGTLAALSSTASADASAILIGNVVGPDGAGVPATVTVVSDGNAMVRTATATGHFEIAVAAGPHKVNVDSTAPTVPFGTFWYHGTSANDSELLTLGDGEQRVLDDIRLPAPATVQGRVLRMSGLPAAGVDVAAELPDHTFPRPSVTTASDGSFTIDRLTPGPRGLVADPFARAGGPVHLGDVIDGAAASYFQLAEGEVRGGFLLHLPDSTEPLRLSAVEPASVAAGTSTVVTASGLGFFRLAPSTGVSGTMGGDGPGQSVVPWAPVTYVDAHHLSWPIAVPATAVPGRYDLTLGIGSAGTTTCSGCLTVTAAPPGLMGVLKGTVKQGGAPLAGAIVQATPVHRPPSTFDPTTTTAADGSYRLELPTGDYLVHFDGGPAYKPEWNRDAVDMVAAAPMTVGAGATVTANATLTKAAAPLAVTMPKPVTVAGGSTATSTVKGSGFKARGVTGLAFSAGPGVEVSVVRITSDTSVEVRVTAAPGTAAGPRDLVATRDGGATATCTGCVLVAAAAPTGPSISSVTPSPLAPGFVGGVDVRGVELAGATSAAVSGAGVTVKSLTVSSPTHLRLRLAVTAGAATGARTLTVALADGRQVTAALVIG